MLPIATESGVLPTEPRLNEPEVRSYHSALMAGWRRRRHREHRNPHTAHVSEKTCLWCGEKAVVTGNEDVVCGDCVPVALGAVLERLRTVSGSGTPEASDVGIGPGNSFSHLRVSP